MLRILRSRRRLALVATALMSFSWFERTVPEQHDGDAAKVSQSVVVPTADDAVAPAPQHAGRSGTPLPRHGVPHPVHLDHCTHSHVATTPLGWELTAPVFVIADAPCAVTDVLLSVDVTPQFRPPIV